MEKPKDIVLAVNLMWLSLVFGLIQILLKGAPAEAFGDGLLTALMVLLTQVIIALLIVKISAGKNWARITNTVLFAIGLPMLATLNLSRTEFIVLLIQTLIQLYAIILLFTPSGKVWFHKDKANIDNCPK